ncbi:MAG TPA: glycosyltransferase, partial [Sedimentisphaerales bacterium]|nr:glycosyltransferase [Sedimentisphaerales bacterium]
MKVLFILPNYEPAWAFGGVVRCISTLCRAMVKIGVDVTVYTTNIDGRGGVLPVKQAELVEMGGVKIYYFQSTFGKNSAWASHQLSRTLDKTIQSFDIIYISAVWQWIAIATSRLAKKHRVPYIMGTHGAFDEVLLNIRKTKKRLYYYLFLKKCIEGAGAIHFTTEYERHQSVMLTSVCHSFIIPNCVAPKEFKADMSLREQLRNELKIPHNASLLLTVGRPDPKKRIDILLKALKKLNESYPDTRLMIVGQSDGKYCQKMKALSETLGVQGNVIWAGHKTGENLDACYLASDLFVLPSIDENFGMAVVEAMAHGVAVVVSDNVGVADNVALSDAGIVTTVDAGQVEKAIRTLLDHPYMRTEMAVKARHAAKQYYNDETVAKLMTIAFKDIITGSMSEQC